MITLFSIVLSPISTQQMLDGSGDQESRSTSHQSTQSRLTTSRAVTRPRYVQVLLNATRTGRSLNPLDSKGNYTATLNNTKLVHWPLMDGLLQLVQQGGAWAGCGPAQSPSRCTKCNSPAVNGQCSLPITVLLWLYDSPSLCGLMGRLNG